MLEGREAHFLSIEKVNVDMEEASGDFFSNCSFLISGSLAVVTVLHY